MSAPVLYGIRNCDSCRKALRWLASHDIEHRFHDVRADGLDRPTLEGWFRRADWQLLFNKRSTTWRGLTDAERADLDETRALALIIAHPTLLRRPVVDTGKALLIGFAEADYAQQFS